VKLECGRCVVRDWERADRPSLVRFASNRNVWRNLKDRFPQPYTDVHAEQWFGMLEAMAEPTHWAIEEDGAVAGSIGVQLDSGHFGYWLGEPFWRRGIMTAAVGRVAPYVLQRLKLPRLQAPVFEWNPHRCACWRNAVFSARACFAAASARTENSSTRCSTLG